MWTTEQLCKHFGIRKNDFYRRRWEGQWKIEPERKRSGRRGALWSPSKAIETAPAALTAEPERPRDHYDQRDGKYIWIIKLTGDRLRTSNGKPRSAPCSEQTIHNLIGREIRGFTKEFRLPGKNRIVSREYAHQADFNAWISARQAAAAQPSASTVSFTEAQKMTAWDGGTLRIALALSSRFIGHAVGQSEHKRVTRGIASTVTSMRLDRDELKELRDKVRPLLEHPQVAAAVPQGKRWKGKVGQRLLRRRMKYAAMHAHNLIAATAPKAQRRDNERGKPYTPEWEQRIDAVLAGWPPAKADGRSLKDYCSWQTPPITVKTFRGWQSSRANQRRRKRAC
jgi:hypothetical protein